MPAKAAGAVRGGRDTAGAEYDTPDEMWKAEAADAAGKEQWYSKGLQYWAAMPATVETVLGGYQRVSPTDVRESDAFLRAVFPAVAEPPGGPRRPLAAADCGAGVGRVTRNLLVNHFDRVDVYEPVAHFLAEAEKDIGASPTPAAGGAPRAVTFVCQPLEEFAPAAGAYDVIWAQWCLGHLTDDDFVRFFTRCTAGLKPDGIIVVKENNCETGFVVDKEDSSLTRSNAYFLDLFAKANLRVIKTKLQRNFPSELFQVRMYALAPA